MTTRKLDRVAAHSALVTVMESPFIAGVLIVPAALALALVWALAGFAWAVLVLLLIGAAVAVGLKFS